jgi:hypothetical protein
MTPTETIYVVITLLMNITGWVLIISSRNNVKK